MEAEKGGALRTPFDLAMDLFYPHKCMFCGRFLGPEAGLVCTACRDALPPAENGPKRGEFYTRCVSACSYEDTVRKSVHRYKFKGCSFYAGEYGRMLAAVVRRELTGKFDFVTFVPIAWLRLRFRGYDQAELLAEALGRELGVPVLRTVKKIRNTKPQSSMIGAAARRANILNAYCPVDAELWAGKRLLLIDDVLTTGATLSEVSRVLLTHGAKSVCCGTFAATPKP